MSSYKDKESIPKVSTSRKRRLRKKMTNKHTAKMQEWNVMQTVTKNGGLNPENTIVTSWAQGALRIIPDILPNAMMFNMLNTESYKPPMMIINLNILRPQTNVLCDNQGSGEGRPLHQTQKSDNERNYEPQYSHCLMDIESMNQNCTYDDKKPSNQIQEQKMILKELKDKIIETDRYDTNEKFTQTDIKRMEDMCTQTIAIETRNVFMETDRKDTNGAFIQTVENRKENVEGQNIVKETSYVLIGMTPKDRKERLTRTDAKNKIREKSLQTLLKTKDKTKKELVRTDEKKMKTDSTTIPITETSDKELTVIVNTKDNSITLQELEKVKIIYSSDETSKEYMGQKSFTVQLKNDQFSSTNKSKEDDQILPTKNWAYERVIKWIYSKFCIGYNNASLLFNTLVSKFKSTKTIQCSSPLIHKQRSAIKIYQKRRRRHSL